MSISRLECLAEAIVDNSGYRNPEGRLYQIRNPGALKAWDSISKRDLDNYRVFDTFKGGYHALLTDLQRKCAGNSHTNLKPSSTLKDLIAVNGFSDSVLRHVVNFLRRALQDQSISGSTPLSFFLEQ